MASDIAAKIEQWRGKLLDTSKRNRLISFKAGHAGGVGLVYPGVDRIWEGLVAEEGCLSFIRRREHLGEPEREAIDDDDDGHELASSDLDEEGPTHAGGDDLARCLRSPRLGEIDLLTDLTDKALAARLNRLARDARTSLSELGVTTLHLAFGLLRWYEAPDSQVELRAPLMLLPARLDRENVEAPWSLRLEEQEVASNHSLAQLLLDDFGIKLPSVPEDLDPDDPEARSRYLDEVRRSIREVPRWAVLDEAALGIFGFQKVAMWEDLGRNLDRIAAHGLCWAIAGDLAARPESPGGLPLAADLDQAVRPEQTFHILDADSSQHEAIVAVGRGANLVIDGPPGTGKSQTIANVIAEALAAGKRSCSSARRRRPWRWSSGGSTRRGWATSAWSATATRRTRRPSSPSWVAASAWPPRSIPTTPRTWPGCSRPGPGSIPTSRPSTSPGRRWGCPRSRFMADWPKSWKRPRRGARSRRC
jgi:Protein of unknown function (DUF4011)